MPTALAVGLGEACRVAALEMENDTRHIRNLHNRLVNGICNEVRG